MLIKCDNKGLLCSVLSRWTWYLPRIGLSFLKEAIMHRDLKWLFTISHYVCCSYRYNVEAISVVNRTKMGRVKRNRAFELAQNITKTCLYKFDPLKPHIYIVKLGFTGVCIIFLISAQKHRLWVLVRTASSWRFERVPTIYALSRNMKNIRFFYLKIFIFWW